MMRTPSHQKEEREHYRKVRGALEAIVIGAGVGRLSAQPNFEEKVLPQISRDVALISGQKPQLRHVKRSIAGFKVREGQIVGLKVTLRRAKMVDFFKRLITIVLPRVRDFKGIDLRAVDGIGALNIGFREQFVFPEVNPEQSPVAFSLGVSIVPRGKSREEAIAAYRRFGMPFKRK